MRILVFLVAIAITTMVSPCLALAQGVSISRGKVKLIGFGKIDIDKTIDYWADQERASATADLNLQAELIAEICDLSEDETAKLRHAGAAVARRRLLDGRKQMRQFIFKSKLATPDEKEPVSDEVFTDVLTPFKAAEFEVGIVALQARFEEPLHARPLWKKMLQSVLSQTQFQTYANHYRDRNRMFVNASITQAITDLDAQVYLTAEQRHSIQESVQTVLDPLINMDSPSSIEQANQHVLPWFKERENLAAFLRKTQQSRLAQIDEAKNQRGVSWTK
jgi:hypothetical protein